MTSMTTVAERVQQSLRAIPDYPKPGILFQDITPVLRDGPTAARRGLRHVPPVSATAVSPTSWASKPEASSWVERLPPPLGPDSCRPGSRGSCRGSGPRESYDLEYGSDSLEAHRDAWTQGSRVLVVDDVLATGGTARAAGQLARGLGAELVGWSFLLEIGVLKRAGAPLRSLCHVVARS